VEILAWFGIIFFGIAAYANFKTGKRGLGYISILFVIAACGMLFSGAQSRNFLHPLPKGVSSPESVVSKAVKSSNLTNELLVSKDFGDDTGETDQVRVMENSKTHRYVFNYKIKNKTIPVYAVYCRVKGNQFNAFLIPVKHNNIYNIETDGYVVDKQIKADNYYGYSSDEVEEMNISTSFVGSRHDTKSVGDYIITYR